MGKEGISRRILRIEVAPRPLFDDFVLMRIRFAAPELTSMWSSMVHDEGAEVCAPYLTGLALLMEPVVASDSVASVVGCILMANLSSKDESIMPCLLKHLNHIVSQLLGAFVAAFSGSMYKERQWGPGPLSKAISHLTLRPEFGLHVYRHVSITCLCKVKFFSPLFNLFASRVPPIFSADSRAK
eukprot:m.107819 g.107819  ORF g.107819 m.107819 type:complete len:184 (+) comp51710_c0_seq7:337-888(+)